jgi:hypothetical protein
MRKSNLKVAKTGPELSETMQKWAAWVRDTFSLEQHHEKILQLACQAFDRGQQARELLDRLGLTYQDRNNCPCVRPEAAVEARCRLDFSRLLKALGLSEETANPPGRPAGSTKRPGK